MYGMMMEIDARSADMDLVISSIGPKTSMLFSRGPTGAMKAVECYCFQQHKLLKPFLFLD